MLKKKRKIGEILMDNGFISKEILERALEYQYRFGGTVTQYLVAGGYIKEEDLARCISIQFGYPYLPLRAYDIPPHIINLIPARIAQKYWLMPVDKIGSMLMLAVTDPYDTNAVEEVKARTGLKVKTWSPYSKTKAMVSLAIIFLLFKAKV